MKLALIVFFFITAMLYASVGFGGGSTYNALLVMAGADYRAVPIVALACNIVVVSGNVMRFGRAGHLDLSRCWPLMVLSVPAAWFGGRLPVSETIFVGLLAAALLFAGVRLIWTARADAQHVVAVRSYHPFILAVLGAGVGFYAGLVGIGGGIFLAPILYVLRWGRAKTIAATCSLFILVNSLSGLLGQASKLSERAMLDMVLPYVWLIPAVFFGGLIGSYLGALKLPEKWIKRLTAVLIVYVGLRLSLRFVRLMSG